MTAERAVGLLRAEGLVRGIPDRSAWVLREDERGRYGRPPAPSGPGASLG
jgi:hypothetical protein